MYSLNNLWYIDYARGMTVYSESEVWPEFGDIIYLASNVTDGNPDTRWAPKSTPCSLIIDLGTPRDIDRMVIRETAQYVGRIQGYEVSCSNELSGAYQVIADGGEAGTLCRVDFGNMINARFFKLEITASNNADGPNIDSVELYNTTDEPGPEEIEWQEFLNDTSWWNELDINGVGEASLIADPNGGTLQLEVTERPWEKNVTDQVTWSIDDPDTASLSEDGLVTAKKPGSVTVTAEASLNGVEKKGSLVIDILDEDATYKADWDSLTENYEVPEWYRDAKLGIFIHWGVYTVPEYSSEWLPRNMYFDGDVKNEMIRRYGPLSEKGYKDLVPLFTAEKYDPAAWVDLFEKAGAKYIVPVAEHHDGIAMYDSDLTRWNVADIGPEIDVIATLQDEVQKAGLKFGVSNHFLENQLYYQGGKNDPDADASDPRWFDLYNNGGTCTADVTDDANRYYSSAHMENWYQRSKELIDKFEPDLLYYDWTLDQTPYTAQALSYYYNRAETTNPEGVVVNYKYNLPEGSAVYDIERGQASEILPMAWQTCSSVSNSSWSYVQGDSYKSPVSLISLLIDVVSKNGNLLLNVGPDKYGEMPEEAVNILTEIGAWLDVNGEGIFSTRPWYTFGEGPTQVEGGGFSETNIFTEKDIRFTTSKDKKSLYVIGMKWPESGQVQVETLNSSDFSLSELDRISLLGSAEDITYSQNADGLTLQLPAESPNGRENPYIVKLEFEDRIPGNEEIDTVIASRTDIEPAGGESRIKVTGTNLEEGMLVQAFENGQPVDGLNAYTTGNGSEQTAVLSFPENGSGQDKEYEIRAASVDGSSWHGAVKITHHRSENLALDASAANSGENYSDQGPDKALDADPMSRWSSLNENADDTWFEIDFGEEKTFDRLVIDEYVNAEDPENIRNGRLDSFTLSYQDGEHWIKFFDSEDVSGTDADYEVQRADLEQWDGTLDENLYRDMNGNVMQNVHTVTFDPVTAQKIRIDCTLKKELSFFEVKVYHEEEQPEPVDPSEPSDPGEQKEPDNSAAPGGSDDSEEPSAGSGGDEENTGNGGAVQTGDPLNLMPYLTAVVLAGTAAGAAVTVKRRKRD